MGLLLLVVVLVSNIELQMIGIKRAICPHDTLPENTLSFVATHSSNSHEVAVTKKDMDDAGYLL